MAYVGQTFGRYRIDGEIGAGGMGVVYRAYDKKLERELAIKVLAPGTLNDDAARKRFRHEALVLSRLNHPNIQTIYDFESFEGQDFLISELVLGVSLDERVRSGALPEKTVVNLGYQLAQGLAAAHAAGVLHRDLKPANLRGTTDNRLKILDFGLATLSRDALLKLSATQTVVNELSGMGGTLPYMSPEQLLGEEIDERSDIYSAGVVLFELATQQLPFNDSLVPKLTNAIVHKAAPAPRTINPKLSTEFDRIVLKCLEKDPELRYQSAKELAADLRRIEVGSSKSTGVEAVRVSRSRRKSRWMFAAAGCVAVIAVLVGVVLWNRRVAGKAGTPPLRWEQVTNFTDSASVPAISPDGKVVAFIRGLGRYGGSVAYGQVWFKTLPDGDPIELTNQSNSKFGKHTLAFSADGNKIYFTQIEGRFTWNTQEVSLLGGQPPRLFMANATGLTWIAKDRLLFSEMKEGLHMSLATSNVSRTEKRDIYVPPDMVNGMVHRSALSPDGRWVLAAEMDSRWWTRCRVLPFDGSSAGREVGPAGSCTVAQWSPDGKWMYFTADSGAGFHVWRQRFPDGPPEQLTTGGASEEEGLAILPDGKSFITAAGSQEASIWVHDASGDKQVTFEGFAFVPTLSPDGKRIYYLRRSAGSRSFLSGELYVADVASGRTQRLLPGFILSHYSLSHDGKQIIVVPEIGGEKKGLFLADATGVEPPRQISTNAAQRAFFGRPGEIIYESGNHIMRVREDGTGDGLANDHEIIQIASVSPDGQWAVAGVASSGTHRSGAILLKAIPLNGGDPVTLCDSCVVGFGSSRMYSSFATWSHDGKWIYIPVRYYQSDSTKTIALPVRAGEVPAAALIGRSNEEEFARIPGVRWIPEKDVAPGMSPDSYAFVRGTAKMNLYRIYLPN